MRHNPKSTMLALSALAAIGAPHLFGRKQITDTNRVHRDKSPDPMRQHEAELKRARKAAKRLRIDCRHASDIREGKCTECGYAVYSPVEISITD